MLASVIRPPLQFHAALAPAHAIPRIQHRSICPPPTRHTELQTMCLCRWWCTCIGWIDLLCGLGLPAGKIQCSGCRAALTVGPFADELSHTISWADARVQLVKWYAKLMRVFTSVRASVMKCVVPPVCTFFEFLEKTPRFFACPFLS